MLMRIKGIKPVTVRKGGKVYRYYRHRATGVRLTAEFSTAAFAAEAAALDAITSTNKREPKPGTLGLLIARYRSKPEFTTRAARTRADYEKVFDYLAPLADMPLAAITPGLVYEIRDKAFKQRKRRFANYVLQVLRLVLEWGRKRGLIDSNEAREVETIRRPKGLARANRPWTDVEREAVLAAATPELAAMIALGMFAGLREGDACRLPKSAYDGSAITAIASKNGEPLFISAHFRLRTILERAGAVETERARKRRVVALQTPTLAVNRWGQAWTQNGFRASFFKLIHRLQKGEKVRPGLTFHGLRHTVGKLIVEAGGTSKDVGAVLGDRSGAMAEHYSRDYDKAKRVKATIRKLERNERKKMDKFTD